MALTWLYTCILLLILSKSDASRILAIGPMPYYSHQLVFESIWRELSLRGHEVVLMTVNPIKDPKLTNLTEIDWSYSYDLKNQQNFDDFLTGKETGLSFFRKLKEFVIILSSYQLEHPEVQKLIHDESQNFDLVISELTMPTYSAFSHRFKCPYIGILSMEMPAEFYSILGSPQHPAIHPSVAFPFYRDLTFYERLQSSLFQFVMEVFIVPGLYDTNAGLVRKYFGDNYPDLHEIYNNIDMVFHNVNPVFSINKPVVPAVVEFGGGIHFRPLKPLPKDIKNFLDAAKNGVVYFSLGSNILSEFVDDGMRQAILETFASLPYSILWKFEDDSLKVSDNIKLLKWAPQHDILRHPKIKLFISQCGLQSLEESLYSHVPVVCMPYFADQPKNARIVNDLGIGVQVDKNNLTTEAFKTAILEVIDNPMYKEKMVELARLSKDQPMSGMEKVIWWTEYVIRNKGAKNLRSALKDMPFYQYYLLDVVGFIAVVLFVVLNMIFKTSKYLYRLCKSKICKTKTCKKAKTQ